MTTSERIPAGHFCWTDLGTPDLDRAVDFYGAVLGWTVERGGPEFHGYSNATLDGRKVAGLMTVEPESGQAPAWGMYVCVDDAEAAALPAQEHGAKPFMDVPVDVGTLGRMWLAFDPNGALFGIWQPGDHPGFEAFGQPGAPVWFELSTTDEPTARDFYAAVFGWTYEQVGEPGATYTIISAGGTGIGGIWVPNPGDDVFSGWAPYFAVADADAAVATVRANAGRVCREPFDIPYGRIAVVQDPWAATFFVMVPQPPPDA